MFWPNFAAAIAPSRTERRCLTHRSDQRERRGADESITTSDLGGQEILRTSHEKFDWAPNVFVWRPRFLDPCGVILFEQEKEGKMCSFLLTKIHVVHSQKVFANPQCFREKTFVTKHFLVQWQRHFVVELCSGVNQQNKSELQNKQHFLFAWRQNENCSVALLGAKTTGTGPEATGQRKPIGCLPQLNPVPDPEKQDRWAS